MKQKQWDEYEAVILLEAYIQIYEGKIDRKKAISNVSARLRQIALHEGNEIDDIFRNVAGITFQMYSMESAFHGKTIRKPATKLFSEVVLLRKNNREKYDLLLKETRRMAAASDRDQYQAWLISAGMRYTAARNYGNWLNNIDEYAMDNGYSEKSVYEYEDAAELVKLCDRIRADEEFIQSHRDYLTSLRKFILYRSNGVIQLGRGSRSSIGEISPKRYKYQEWLIERGMKENAARNYGNWLINISDYAMEKGYIEKPLYDFEDVAELSEVYELVSADAELVSNHRDYLTSLRKYISYRSDGAIEFARLQYGVKSSSHNDQEQVKLTDTEKTHFIKVLRDYFEEGLVPNAIRLDKFRMLYKKEFGGETIEDDELLALKLKASGIFIDGRIFPKQEESQNNLLAEIRQEITTILNEGASCVYISCVMMRWQLDLKSLSIYNETALRDILISEHMPGVFATDIMFKSTQGKVHPEKDILEYMKKCHTPVTYHILQKKLWFIPIETIKHALVCTPALVQVDWETYMYAQNFPASSRELQHLFKVMKAKISERGFLVSKDIAQLITEECPTIAINTEGYKDWAYRNVLRYIFRDYFEFSSSVISEKGKKLEMWQVYRAFCRDYEHLTFDELKRFSEDVGVQIYWDDVLSEMIRINNKELICKDLVHFDVDATDRILDEICREDYLPIKEVGFFLHFPAIEYTWNSYVLESYLQYSKRFMLYHVSYSENGVFGVVVRRHSGFADYRQVVIDMLARSNEWSNTNNALALIVEKGYQARKRWTGFDKVVQEALVRREQLLTERK